MNRRRLLPLTVLMALVLALGACGDDDAVDTVADDAEDAAEDAAGDALAAQFGGECRFLGEFAGGIEDAFDPSAIFGGDGSTEFGAFFQTLAENFEEVAAAAPSDIDEAFDTMAEAFTALADELDGVELDFSNPQDIDPEVLARLESLGSMFESDELESAAEEIETWISDNCSVPE